MEVAAILALIEKGLTVIGAIVAMGQEVGPAIESLINLVRGAQTGDVTDEQMAQTEALLDKLIGDFNLDI